MYKIIRTDTADSLLNKLIMNIASRFDVDTALKVLDNIEENINLLSENPYIGVDPRYMVLKRQGFKVLIIKKSLVFYKINEEKMLITVYAIVDDRQDYIDIIQGL